MEVLSKIATALRRRDEVPNQELAKEIAAGNDKKAVKELIINLDNKSKDIQHDCIKVIYEIGLIKPGLISPYSEKLLTLLESKNNRMQWGGMTALNAITLEDPDLIYAALPRIISAADKGSVITRDHCVSLLLKLCTVKKYAENAFDLLSEQLLTCPANQLPMYAENAMPLITEKNKKKFVSILTSRLNDIEKETKRKRVEKVIKDLRE